MEWFSAGDLRSGGYENSFGGHLYILPGAIRRALPTKDLLRSARSVRPGGRQGRGIMSNWGYMMPRQKAVSIAFLRGR